MNAELPKAPPVEQEELFFVAALEREEPERSAFLDGACHGDPALRQRLQELLNAHARPNPDLNLPNEAARLARPALSGEPTDPGVGQKVGPYKLLEKIGEGGCGVVYVAEQLEPIRRRVAIKVIKLGMDTKEVIARFEVERQALALMDHPNIARVLDAGATGTPGPADGGTPFPEGRPYFVMELVRGIRITDYCDQQHLSTQNRLDLFMKVCQAIQHAHQKGIIHRDIKSSNILVTMHDGVPVPKVIDFGIAKAVEGRLSDDTAYTRLHPFIGTPAYMSPEQAEMSGLDVDTRSDIYSLGVLLYELLTGRTPFDGAELQSLGVDAMRKAIRDREPSIPSLKLATLEAAELTKTAQRRSCDAPRLIALLKGDLDWIVMKCLEKDRSRRYATANGLTADIQRHLNHEPVVARPPSAGDRLQKAFLRHRVAFSAAAAVALALVLGLAGSLWEAIRANRAEALAAKRLAESEAISTFLTEVFQRPDPASDGRTVTVAETLDAAARRLHSDSELSGQPGRRAQLQWTLAMTYQALGLPTEAITLFKEVQAYRRSTAGRDDRETLAAARQLGLALLGARNLDEAISLQEALLASHRRLHGKGSPEAILAMVDLSGSYTVAGRREEARSLARQALELSRKVNGPEHPDTLLALQNLGLAYPNAQGLELREEAYALSRKISGADSKTTLRAAGSLALCYAANGRDEDQIKLLEWLVPLSVRLRGPDNPLTSWALETLERAYYAVGRWRDALQLRADYARWNLKDLNPGLLVVQAWFHREADYQASCRRLLKLVEGTPLPVTAERAAKAALLLPASDPAVLEAAHTLARRAVALGGEDPSLGLFQLALGMAEYRRGNYHAADQAFLASEKAAPLNVGFFRAMSLYRQGQVAEARRLFERTAGDMPALPDDDHNPLANGASADQMAIWLAYREAAALLGVESSATLVDTWLERLQSEVAADPADTIRSLKLALAWLWLGRTAEHEQLCRRNLANAAQSKDPAAHDRAAKAYLLRPDPDPDTLKLACASARKALAYAAPEDENLPWFRTVAGIAAFREGNLDEAEALLSSAVIHPLHENQRRLALAFRAMARGRARREDQARADLAGLSRQDFALPDASRVTSIIRDQDQLAVRLACHQAAAELNGGSTPAEAR